MLQNPVPQAISEFPILFLKAEMPINRGFRAID